MGNNPSAALAAVNAKRGLSSAVQDVNKSLGLGENSEAAAEAERQRQLVGTATRKEARQRQQERGREYKQKQNERADRKAALQAKWEKAHSTDGGAR
jgi:hypothetical protein